MGRLINAFKAFFSVLLNGDLPKAPAPKQPPADTAHIKLLASFQQTGRLVDFLQEDISSYSDAQVGAAVRQLHSGCRQSIEELVTIRPVFEQEEGSRVTIPAGYDASRIKLVGSVKGTGPFTGELMHPGWRALRKGHTSHASIDEGDVLQAAEVEIR